MTPAAVLNHLWQSTVFAGVAAVVALGLRGNQARARFWVWMAASLKFLVPFSGLAALGALLPWPEAKAAAAPALAAASAPFRAGAASLLDYTAAGGGRGASLPHGLLPWLAVAAWLAGSLALLGRWGWRWRRLARIAHAAAPRQVQGIMVGAGPSAPAARVPLVSRPAVTARGGMLAPTWGPGGPKSALRLAGGRGPQRACGARPACARADSGAPWPQVGAAPRWGRAELASRGRAALRGFAPDFASRQSGATSATGSAPQLIYSPCRRPPCVPSR